jgi:hypothetical protein
LWNSLWLKLFGADGVTTFAEFRDALLGARLHGVADDGVVGRVRAIANAYVHDSQPGGEGPLVRLVGQDGSLQLRPLLPIIPFSTVDEPERVSGPGTDTIPSDALVTDPAHVLAPGNGRIVTLLVAADPAIALGLLPIAYGPANVGDLFHDATRDNPFGNGWLATWLAQQSVPMQIGWDADSLGQASTDLGLLLGPVLGSIALSGDFSAGFTLAPVSAGLEQVTLAAGHDYNLMVGDNCVAAGQSLLVDASALGAGDHAAFDGSTVT